MPQLSVLQAAALQRDGKIDEAIAAFRLVLATEPDHPDALHFLGLALAQKDSPLEGARLIQRAIRLRPNVAVYYSNLGYALEKMGRSVDAVRAYRHALRLDPNDALSWRNLGNSLLSVAEIDQAVAAFSRAISINPGQAEAHNSLGRVHMERKQLDLARVSFERATQLNPQFAEAFHNLAGCLADSGQIDQAIDIELGAWKLSPQTTAPLSGRLYMLHFHPGYDRASIAGEMRAYDEHFGIAPAQRLTPIPQSLDPEKRLKVGYVSSDFYLQSECFFFLPLIQAHDHTGFEFHCYSSAPIADHITARIRKHADVWHEVKQLTDRQLAERIVADGIDILVDLSMHMRGNRLPLFALKAAPIQVTWLAFPGGTGLSSIDYRFTDAYLDPPDCDSFYVEKSIRLPGTWCCYSPLAQVRIAPREKSFLRFASLNNPIKLNEATLRLWAQVLTRVPDSRLLILAHSADHQKRIARSFESAGVSASRLEFTGYRDRIRYLEAHNQIDACLDPTPYNGITTSLDALWMGVPVISLVGQTAPSRAGLSILTNVGLAEYLAHTPEQFVEIAAGIRHPDREKIRQKLLDSPVCNASLFAANMQNAYREMWHQYVAGTG